MREGSHPSTLAAPVTRAGASTITPPKPSSQPVPTVVSHAHETFLAASSQHNNQHSAPNATMPAPIQPRAVTGFSGFIVSFISLDGWCRGGGARGNGGADDRDHHAHYEADGDCRRRRCWRTGQREAALAQAPVDELYEPQPRNTPSTEPMTPRMSA